MTAFGRLGRLVVRRHRWLLAAWAIVLLGAAPIAQRIVDELRSGGFTLEDLPIGTVIRVAGYQAMTGDTRGVGAFLTYPDGRKVLMGGSAPGATGPAAR